MPFRQTAVREWVIFALSIGSGGHLVLAMVLHAPEQWPWHQAGTYALLSGLTVYVVVQVGRSLWWTFKGKSHSQAD